VVPARPRPGETDAQVRLDVVQDVWRQRAAWQPDNWTLQLVALRGGELVATQCLFARDFAVVRGVGTSSWVLAGLRGQGVGKEMRAASCTWPSPGWKPSAPVPVPLRTTSRP